MEEYKIVGECIVKKSSEDLKNELRAYDNEA